MLIGTRLFTMVSSGVEVEPSQQVSFTGVGTAQAVSELNGRKGGAVEMALYQKTTMGAGQHAANPMLQETPDPLTKVTWDNYVTMAHSDVDAMGLNGFIGQEKPASLVKVTVGGSSMELPVFPMPGQTPGTIGIALGYGRGANGENIGKAAFQTGENGSFETNTDGNPVPVGQNVFPWANESGTFTDYAQYDVTIEATGGTYPLLAHRFRTRSWDVRALSRRLISQATSQSEERRKARLLGTN